jgi:two-component system, OmpR family, response regulator
LERLRKQKLTPVLMLTARDAIKDRIRGLDTGADDYLSEAIRPAGVARAIALAHSPRRRQCMFKSRDWGDRIDTRSRSVLKAGEPVALTAREYASESGSGGGTCDEDRPPVGGSP